MIEFKARVQYDISSDERVLITRIKDIISGRLYILQPIVKQVNFISHDDVFLPGYANGELPNITSSQFIQGVMDAGFEAGFRPIGYKDVQNETLAIKSHLDDMRNIVLNSKAINWK